MSQYKIGSISDLISKSSNQSTKASKIVNKTVSATPVTVEIKGKKPKKKKAGKAKSKISSELSANNEVLSNQVNNTESEEETQENSSAGEEFEELQHEEIQTKKGIKRGKEINEEEDNTKKNKKLKENLEEEETEVVAQKKTKKKAKKESKLQEATEHNAEVDAIQKKKKKKSSKTQEATESDNEDSMELKDKDVSSDSVTKENETSNDDQDDLDLVDDRTIFVGNWPVNKLKKHLKALFKEYGSIDTVRFRSVPLKDPRISKRVSAITKQFHPDRTSVNAYVRFADVESANKALAANGLLYCDHHLRVTLSNKCKFIKSHTIFIGNLNFNVEDEELWKVFSVCGEIESVRILRDAKTGMSRGCAYVNFKSDDGVELAMQMPETSIKDRVIRIKRPESKPNKSKVKSENFLNKFNKQISKNIPKKSLEKNKKTFQGSVGAKRNNKNFKRAKRPRPSFQAKSKKKFNKSENVAK